MAVTPNKVLLTNFANIFKSGAFIDISKTILCGKMICNCIFGRPVAQNFTYGQLNDTFERIVADPRITDKNLVQGIFNLDVDELKMIAPDMLAEVFECDAFISAKPRDKVNFKMKVDQILSYHDVSGKEAEDVVLNAKPLRRIVEHAHLKPLAKQKALDEINKKVAEFATTVDDQKLFMPQNTSVYTSLWATKTNDALGKMRLSDQIFYRDKKFAEALADARDASVLHAKTKAEREAIIAFHQNAHDKTRLAACEAFGKTPVDYPDMFLAQNVSGGNSSNPHYIAKFLGTFALSAGTSAALKVAIPLLAATPIGAWVGPMMAGAFTVGAGLFEIGRLAKTAISRREWPTKREWINVGINLGTRALPYAVMLAGGTYGRVAGALVMGAKTFALNLVNRRDELAVGETLSFKDYAQMAGSSISQAVAMVLGSLVGGDLIGEAFNKSKLGVGLQEKVKTWSEAKTAAKVAAGTGAVTGAEAGNVDAAEEIEQSGQNAEGQTGTENATVAGQEQPNGTETDATTASEAQPTPTNYVNKNITASEKDLQELREYKFNINDAARSTANPDNDQMFQLQESGQYKQQDWYNIQAYNRAVTVLHDAGVQDADGALRKLAGASMFKGGAYRVELNNLLDGKLSSDTIKQIIAADKILDDNADLIGRIQQAAQAETKPAIKSMIKSTGGTQATSNQIPTRSGDFSLSSEGSVDVNPYNDAEPVTQTQPNVSSTETTTGTPPQRGSSTSNSTETSATSNNFGVPQRVGAFNLKSGDSLTDNPYHDAEPVTSDQTSTTTPANKIHDASKTTAKATQAPVKQTANNSMPTRIGNFSIKQPAASSESTSTPTVSHAETSASQTTNARTPLNRVGEFSLPTHSSPATSAQQTTSTTVNADEKLSNLSLKSGISKTLSFFSLNNSAAETAADVGSVATNTETVTPTTPMSGANANPNLTGATHKNSGGLRGMIESMNQAAAKKGTITKESFRQVENGVDFGSGV